MAKDRRRFFRPSAYREFRTLYVISTEGTKTEPQYFNLFKSCNNSIRIRLLCKKNSAPKYVLRRVEEYVRSNELKKNDEVWLVIDKDNWTQEQIDELYNCCCQRKYNLAVSNPQFEYWLLLHFENAAGVATKHECLRRLQRHLPNYKKNRLDLRKIERNVIAAVERAERIDVAGGSWPTTTGTTVYKLVQKLLN